MTQKVCDHVSQAWFSIKVFTVKIKIVVLCTSKNQSVKKQTLTPLTYNRQEAKLKEYQELTSYIIPAGTNSGALAERFDEFTADSSWVHLLAADAMFACALCWGLLCLFRSEN